MTSQDCIAHFVTTSKLAEALRITKQSVSGWGEYPPDLRQIQLERLTKGKLKAEPSVWRAAK